MIADPHKLPEDPTCALDDKGKAAIIVDEKLLTLLIRALEECPVEFGYSVAYWRRSLNDLKQLRKTTFGR